MTAWKMVQLSGQTLNIKFVAFRIYWFNDILYSLEYLIKLFKWEDKYNNYLNNQTYLFEDENTAKQAA